MTEANDTRRGTGRTTRVIEAAIKAAGPGVAPVIVAANLKECDRLERELRSRGAHYVVVLSRTSSAVDMDQVALGHAAPMRWGPVFFDHYALECEIADVDQEIRRLREKRTKLRDAYYQQEGTEL